MPSHALGSFQATLGLAESLLCLESGYPDPAPTQDEATVKALRGGATVLMVAAFENYLRTVIVESLEPFHQDPPRKPRSQLPLKLQTAAVFASLDHALKGPRHGPSEKKSERLPRIAHACTLVVNDRIDIACLANTGGNPDSARVAELLGNLDIADPFTELNRRYQAMTRRPIAHTFVRDTLDSIVSRRHEVAHTASASASRADLSDGAEFLRTLAQVVDEAVTSRVAGY